MNRVMAEPRSATREVVTDLPSEVPEAVLALGIRTLEVWSMREAGHGEVGSSRFFRVVRRRCQCVRDDSRFLARQLPQAADASSCLCRVGYVETRPPSGHPAATRTLR